MLLYVLSLSSTDKGQTQIKLRGVKVNRANWFKIVRPPTGCTGEKNFQVCT